MKPSVILRVLGLGAFFLLPATKKNSLKYCMKKKLYFKLLLVNYNLRTDKNIMGLIFAKRTEKERTNATSQGCLTGVLFVALGFCSLFQLVFFLVANQFWFFASFTISFFLLIILIFFPTRIS